MGRSALTNQDSNGDPIALNPPPAPPPKPERVVEYERRPITKGQQASNLVVGGTGGGFVAWVWNDFLTWYYAIPDLPAMPEVVSGFVGGALLAGLAYCLSWFPKR